MPSKITVRQPEYGLSFVFGQPGMTVSGPVVKQPDFKVLTHLAIRRLEVSGWAGWSSAVAQPDGLGAWEQ